METEMADSSQQDHSAVTAVRSGDTERYHELVERHERRIYAVAWSQLGDAALAEEVTQEAFIRAYRRLWLLGDGAKFSSWVATIARRLAINFGLRNRRELNRRERWALEYFSEAAPEKPADESEPVHSPETLRQTLAELPAAHRECLVLFYLEGKSGADAASVLGISEAALRVRLHRARAALRERLEEKLEGSLQQMRPSKALIPAIMVGVLTSSPAKAATGGAIAAGAGAKIVSALSKMALFSWLLPFITLVGNIPSLIAVSVIMRKERENFRDAHGFRPELHRHFFASFIWGFLLLLVGFAILNQSFLVAWGIKTHQLALAVFGLVITLISARSLTICRNQYQVGIFAYCIIIAAGLSALAVGWLPPSLAQLPILAATIPFPTSLPDFIRLFPEYAACAAHLEKVRWPEGFACGFCRWQGEPCRFPNRSSVVLRYRRCKRDTWLTASTIMQRTHTPISPWFGAAYLVSSQTPGLSAVQPGTHITTDDWSGYARLAEQGYRLTQVAQGGDPEITKQHLPLIHLVFGNLKAWLNGVHHGVSPQHLQAYLNEFTFRFNRRFYPFNAFRSLLGIGAATGSMTYGAL